MPPYFFYFLNNSKKTGAIKPPKTEKAKYSLGQLQDKQVELVVNLAPRKKTFGFSEGIVLAVGPGNEDIFVLSSDEGAQHGMEVPRSSRRACWPAVLFLLPPLSNLASDQLTATQSVLT